MQIFTIKTQEDIAIFLSVFMNNKRDIGINIEESEIPELNQLFQALLSEKGLKDSKITLLTASQFNFETFQASYKQIPFEFSKINVVSNSVSENKHSLEIMLRNTLQNSHSQTPFNANNIKNSVSKNEYSPKIALRIIRQTLIYIINSFSKEIRNEDLLLDFHVVKDKYLLNLDIENVQVPYKNILDFICTGLSVFLGEAKKVTGFDVAPDKILNVKLSIQNFDFQRIESLIGKDFIEKDKLYFAQIMGKELFYKKIAVLANGDLKFEQYLSKFFNQISEMVKQWRVRPDDQVPTFKKDLLFKLAQDCVVFLESVQEKNMAEIIRKKFNIGEKIKLKRLNITGSCVKFWPVMTPVIKDIRIVFDELLEGITKQVMPDEQKEFSQTVGFYAPTFKKDVFLKEIADSQQVAKYELIALLDWLDLVPQKEINKNAAKIIFSFIEQDLKHTYAQLSQSNDKAEQFKGQFLKELLSLDVAAEEKQFLIRHIYSVEFPVAKLLKTAKESISKNDGFISDKPILLEVVRDYLHGLTVKKSNDNNNVNTNTNAPILSSISRFFDKPKNENNVVIIQAIINKLNERIENSLVADSDKMDVDDTNALAALKH